MSSKARVFAVATAVVIVLAAMSSYLEAAQVQLSWNAPTTNADDSPLTDLAGYRLHYGQSSGSYSSSVNVGNQTTYSLSGLTGGQRYYFVVTAYDTSGNESVHSNEASATPTDPDTTPPTAGDVSVPDGSTGVDPNTSITATFSEAMDPATITTSTIQLRDASGTLVAATVTYDPATKTATLDPTSPLAPGTTYTVTIEGGTNGVKDAAGNPLAADVTWSFTTAPSSVCPCSIWSNQATPEAASWSDANAIEVGVKFRADVDGFITGLRFYKGSANTGTHIGHLWTNTGTLLASVTFAGETPSGWQQQDLSTPVALTANTTYVASYHTTVGYYAVNRAYFANAGVDNPPLHALANGVAGGNGVYKYGASGFPTQTFNANNYWVDVVFTTTPSANPPPPPVASFSASPTSGPAPLTVAFTDTSTGDITEWAWAFGDGTTSTAQHPQHTYTSAGTYTVTLTVSGGGGSHSATKNDFILVGAPSTGLVAAYGFDEGGGTTVTDASGNGNHGTIAGARRRSSGRYGKSLLFDGVNDWVRVADAPSLDLSTGMTLEAWIYPTALSGGSANGWRTVIFKQQTGQLIYALYANADNNRPSGYVYTSSDLGVFGNAQLPLKTWRHLATTYDGAALKLYVNGVVVGSRTLTGSIRTSDNTLRIGGNSIWGQHFQGRIDEVRIYNRALTASEIQNDMHTPVATAAGAAQVRLTPSGVRLREALLGSASAFSGTTARDMAQTASDPKPHLRQRPSALSPGTPAMDVEPTLMPHLMEVGEVQVTQQWRRVDFSAAFVEPIVIANALSSHSTAPAIVRIRNVDPTGFEIQVQPWMEVEGALSPETVGFLALERGTYTLTDGTLIEAGNITADPTKPSQGLAFSRPFNVVPVVMTAVTSFNEAEPVTSRLQAATKSGLRFRLHGTLQSPDARNTETLSYIAWEPSSGTLQGWAFDVNRAIASRRTEFYTLMLTGASEYPPVLLAEVQMAIDGGSPLNVRWENKHAHSVDVNIDAGPSVDEEFAALPEVIGYIVLR